jgi:hypothetical protein
VTDPLQFRFEVACTPGHAFATWTERISLWWPAAHTISGAPTAVIIEGRVGGRIYERTQPGEEHDWGVVTVWQPPDLLAYQWHLGVDPESATDVTVKFIPLDGSRTAVEIEQSGWDRLASGDELRGRNRVGWESLLPHFRSAVEKGA